MSTDFEKVEEKQRAQAMHARGMLSDWSKRAVEILQELAEYGENERTRLSAANSILDRAGVVAPTEVKISASPEEHALVRADAEETLAKLARNQAARELPKPALSLEAIVVHEGELEDEALAVASTQ